jgi:hypothetical protein
VPVPEPRSICGVRLPTWAFAVVAAAPVTTAAPCSVSGASRRRRLTIRDSPSEVASRRRSTLALLLNARVGHPSPIADGTQPSPRLYKAHLLARVELRYACGTEGEVWGRRSCQRHPGWSASAVAVRHQRPRNGRHQPDRAAMSTRATLAHLICCDHRKCRVRPGSPRTVSSHHSEARSARHPEGFGWRADEQSTPGGGPGCSSSVIRCPLTAVGQ